MSKSLEKAWIAVELQTFMSVAVKDNVIYYVVYTNDLPFPRPRSDSRTRRGNIFFLMESLLCLS